MKADPQNYFAHKFLPCIIAGLTAGFTFSRISTRLFHGQVPLLPAIIIGLLFLTFTIFYSYRWHKKSKLQQVDNEKTSLYWQDLIAYFIAFDLSMFGWQKLFHLQFFTPLGKLDMPFSSFSGDELLFAFYGHSHAFVIVIGIIEIVGSLFIAIKKTRMLGLFILLPLLLNILIMDYFYGLRYNVVLHAFVMLAGVAYLIFIHYTKLILFFFPALPSDRRRIAATLPALVILLPLVVMTTYAFPEDNPALTGKYSVKELTINNIPVTGHNDQDSILTTVYMDIGNDCVFEYNNLKRRHFGKYTFNPDSNSFEVKWRYPSPTPPPLSASLVRNTDNQLRLDAEMGGKHINCILKKQN
ncbi:MAG: hypothetical protein ABIN67_16090 [Ferruginibacter sp.]